MLSTALLARLLVSAVCAVGFGIAAYRSGGTEWLQANALIGLGTAVLAELANAHPEIGESVSFAMGIVGAMSLLGLAVIIRHGANVVNLRCVASIFASSVCGALAGAGRIGLAIGVGLLFSGALWLLAMQRRAL